MVRVSGLLFIVPVVRTVVRAVIIRNLGIKGTDKRAEAEAFIDFMLTDGQLETAIANSMYPVSSAVQLPEAFDYAPKPGILYQSSGIALGDRERIIDEWTEEMSR